MGWPRAAGPLHRRHGPVIRREGAGVGLIFVDVEATGLSPATGVMTEFGAVEYDSRRTFHGVLHEAEPDPANPAKSRIIGRSFPEADVMQRFAAWLKQVSAGHPVFVSDNPAYDFQWINYYFDKALGLNPFGHSGRRISDYWAGLQRDWRDTQSWKKYRSTPHDHNPVHDAMGNVEAFTVMRRLETSSG